MTGTGGSAGAFSDAILEATADGIVVVDEDGRILRTNPAAAEILGRSEKDLDGAHFGSPVVSDEQGEALVIQIFRPDGRQRDVELRTRRTHLHEQPVWVVVLRDVTEALATQELRERLSAAIEATPIMVAMSDVAGGLFYLNDAGRRMLGLSSDEPVEGRSLGEFQPEWAREVHRDWSRSEALESGLWRGESAYLQPGGAEFPVWQVLLAHRGTSGEVEFLSTMAEDLTARRAAEADLRERVKEIQTLYGVQREIASTDRPIERRLENAVELLPVGWLEPAVTEARIAYMGQRFATDGFRETEWALREPLSNAEMEVGFVEVVLTEELPDRGAGLGPFLAEEGELLKAVARALSEGLNRERLQKSANQAQKMETIGLLAGGVAHDFNNLLTVIQGAAQMLLHELPDESSNREDLEEIVQASMRGSALTRQLLAFSRKEELEEEDLRVLDALDEVRHMLQRLIPERISFGIEGENDASVRVDRGRLIQAIMNLALNAKDAIVGEGRITVRVSTEEIGKARIREEMPWANPGTYVTIAVEDTGQGMTPNEVERIFEPFFTTKEEGKGTGLGLSAVYGFVKQSGGHVLVDTEPGVGTTMRILLPMVPPIEVAGRDDPDAKEDAADREEASGEEEEGVLHGERILLVEDNAAVRSVAVRMLRAMGYDPTEAASGTEALSRAREQATGFDLVISDVVMPDMGGVELARLLKEARPDQRVLFMSGYTDEEVRAEAHDIADGFLQKPFSPEELRLATEAALPD